VSSDELILLSSRRAVKRTIHRRHRLTDSHARCRLLQSLEDTTAASLLQIVCSVPFTGMTAGTQGPGVVTRSWKHEIASSSMDVSFTAFADMNMLVFTDTGSMGTIIRAR
jgi:hypothetical protein